MIGEEDHFLWNDVRILRAKQGPCLVCGDPTGNCSGQSSGQVKILGESFNRSKNEPGVLVEEDIYEEVWLTPYTKTTVLVAKAGTYIGLEKAIELGLKTR